MSGDRTILHATCVALADKGALIVGPSGSGKSSLALNLIALGAVLVADDRTELSRDNGKLFAYCPPSIKGMIEARGVGIILVPCVDSIPVDVVIDMSHQEAARLPQRHSHTILDLVVPCLHNVDAPHFPAAVHAYLRATLMRPDDRA